MNYIDFLSRIDSKRLNPINLIQVKEPYLLDLAINSLKNDLLNDDFIDLNFTKLDFEKLDKNTFLSAVETLPFLDDFKLVFIDNVVLQKDKLKKYETTFEFIDKYLKKINTKTILILAYRGDSLFKGKFVKNIEKIGAFYDFSKLDRRQFQNFIIKHFAKNQIKIDSRQSSFIENRLGYLDRDSKLNLFEVVNELDKLVNNINSNTPSMEEIENAVTEHFDDNIFKLLDSLSSRDLTKALTIFDRMKDQDLFMIFHMVLRQVRNIMCVKDCMDKGVNKQTGMKYCMIGSFEYDKSIRFSKNFTNEELLKLHKMAYWVEKESKSGGNMETLVSRLIFQFNKSK